MSSDSDPRGDSTHPNCDAPRTTDIISDLLSNTTDDITYEGLIYLIDNATESNFIFSFIGLIHNQNQSQSQLIELLTAYVPPTRLDWAKAKVITDTVQEKYQRTKDILQQFQVCVGGCDASSQEIIERECGARIAESKHCSVQWKDSDLDDLDQVYHLIAPAEEEARDKAVDELEERLRLLSCD